MSLDAGSALHLLATIAGTGGALAVHAPDDGHAVYLSSAVPGATVVIGLEDDDVRQLVAVLERRLRELSAGRRLDPAQRCHCGHRRGDHLELHGSCGANRIAAGTGCPCLVMRTPSTVPFGTVHAPDQGTYAQGYGAALVDSGRLMVDIARPSFWDE